MLPSERRAAVSLAGIFSLRMLGMFMILPVFALYTDKIAGATPTLIGLAIGAYGITQALLQIPFGLLSDRLGRKPVIAAGLVLFALGSVIAATSTSIYGIILGRVIQGAGAIPSVVMALAADLTREEQRTKAMAIIGISIGMSFSVALVAGPVLDHWVGISGIFWLTAVLACVGIAVLYLIVPQPAVSSVHRDAQPVPAQFLSVLRDRELLRLDFGILILHMILTASFTVLPLVLRDELGLASAHHWYIYLPALLLSIAAMVPFIIIAERHRRMKTDIPWRDIDRGAGRIRFGILAYEPASGGWPGVSFLCGLQFAGGDLAVVGVENGASRQQGHGDGILFEHPVLRRFFGRRHGWLDPGARGYFWCAPILRYRRIAMVSGGHDYAQSALPHQSFTAGGCAGCAQCKGLGAALDGRARCC